MPATVYTTAVNTINAALYGYAPANAAFVIETNAAALGVNAYANSKVASVAAGGLSNAALATLVLTNMGVNNPALNDAVAAYFANVPNDRGIVILQLGQILTAIADPSHPQHVNYGTAAHAWNSGLAHAYAYSSNPDNTVPSPIDYSIDEVAGTTFVLTAGTAAGADVMGLFGDQNVRIDLTANNHQVKGLDLDGDGVIEANGVENVNPTTQDDGQDFEIVDAYARNRANETDIAANFLGNIAYDGTGFEGDGVNTDGNIVLGGLGADTILGGIGNDFLAGGGVASANGGADRLDGGRNADFFFAELSLLDNTDGNNLTINGGSTSDDAAVGNNTPQDSDWLLLEVSDDEDGTVVNLADGSDLDGLDENDQSVVTGAGRTILMTEVENVDASGNLYGFLDDVAVAIGGNGSVVAGENVGIGSTAQLHIIGSLANNILIGGFDNDRIEGGIGNDLLMGGNLNYNNNPNTQQIVNNGMDELFGGAGDDNIVFEADGGIIEGDITQGVIGAGNDTLWLTADALGTQTAADLTTDSVLRFDLDSQNIDVAAGYGGADVGSTNATADDTQDQTNYAAGVSRTTVQDMDSVIATGLGAVDYKAAGTNDPELNFNNQQNHFGYEGDLTLRGTSGDNTLYASNGTDILEGRAGNDKLSGGNGDDDFVFFLQTSVGDGVDVIHRQADANGDNLWDDYSDSTGTGTFVQDFGQVSAAITANSKLTLTLIDSAHSTDLTGFPVNGVSFKLDGVTYTVSLSSGVQGTYAAFNAGLNAALDANPALAALDSVLNADNTMTITDPAGKTFVSVGYTFVGNVVPPAGTLTWNQAVGGPAVTQTQDRLIYRAYEDRLDGEIVNDNAITGSTISLGQDAYAEDLVINFAADGTRIAEDQSYSVVFKNLTTQDKVTVAVNDVTYTLQVGVDLDGNSIAAEDDLLDTQDNIQAAFLVRLNAFINSFMDNDTAAGQVNSSLFVDTLTLTQVAYNSEETVFMTTPVVTIQQLSAGEAATAVVSNNSQHEVLLFNYDGRNLDGLGKNLDGNNVKFWGDTMVNQSLLQTANNLTGGTITGNNAVVIDGGANDLAGIANNTATNASLATNFSVHGDDFILGGAAVDTINAGTGDDRVQGSRGADVLDGGKNYYAVQVLGEAEARVITWNVWEAANPTSAQALLADPTLAGKVLSSITLINQSENGNGTVSGLFDDTLIYAQGDFVTGSTRFTVTLDNYTVDSGVVNLRNSGAGKVTVDLTGNGATADDSTSTFTNFENIRTVSGTGLAVAGTGGGQGNDTLNLTALSAPTTGTGGILYNLTKGAEAGKVEYSTNAILAAATATTPVGTAAGDSPTEADYETLVIKVDGVENVIAGTGADMLIIDETEAAKDNRFEAGTGIDRINYLNDFAGGVDGAAQPTVTIKVNSASDTDTVTMKGGRVGLLATTSGGATDTLVGVEYIGLGGETAQSNREDDLLDVSAMVTGAVVDYTNGEVRATASGGLAVNTGVQVVIENIVQLETVLADGDDTVIVADADVMNNNARSDEGVDAKAAVDIQLATYLDFDTFNTNGSRKLFANQSGAEVSDVINQNQFTFNLGTVGRDTVDYSNELGRVVAVMNFNPTDPNKFVLVDGNSNGNLADTESRVDKLVSVERIVASLGDSVIDLTNSGRATNVVFSYNQPDQKTAFTEGVEKIASLDRQINVVRVSDAVDQSALGNVDLVEYRDLGDSATIAQATATWNSVQGSDFREYVQFTQWENQQAHTLTLRGGANEVNYNERTDGIYLNISSVNGTSGGVANQYILGVSHLSATGVNLGQFDTITGYNQQNAIGGTANSLRVEASQGDQDFIDVSGFTASGVYLLGQIETSGSSVVTATFVDPVTGLATGSGLTLSGFEYLWDGVGADTYVINDLTNFVSKMTLVDWAQTYNGLTDPATFTGSTDRDTVKLANGAFETATIRPPISQTITLNSNLSMGTAAGANDLQRLGVNNNTQRAAFGTAFEIGNGGLAETSRGFDFQVLDISEVTNQTSITATGSGATEGARDELIVGGLNYLASAGTAIQGFDILSLTNASSGTVFELDKTAGELQGSTNTKIVGVDALLNTLDLSRITGRDVTLTATSAVTGVTLIGGSGNDNITGAAGADTLVGGAGNDTLNGGTATETRAIEIFNTLSAALSAEEVAVTLNGYTDPVTTITEGVEIAAGAGRLAIADALATKLNANLATINTGAAWTGGAALAGVAHNGNGLLTFTFVGGVDVAALETISIATNEVGTALLFSAEATVNGGNGGVDTFEFAATAALNGVDTITGFTAGVGGDVLDLAGLNVKGNALFMTTIDTYNDEAAALTVASVGAEEVNNEVAFMNANGTALTAATLAAEFSAAGTAYLASGINANGVGNGMKSVIVEIDNTLATEAAKVWFVHDANNDGAIAASEVVLVGSLTGAGGFNFDASNFA